MGRTPARGAWIEIDLVCLPCSGYRSHPARGAWIEICLKVRALDGGTGRTPQGVRGLKCGMACHNLSPTYCRTPQGVRGLKCHVCACQYSIGKVSHPARGAWIEIITHLRVCSIPYGRTPQGVRGLKCSGCAGFLYALCRTPQGVRGLKLTMSHRQRRPMDASHPARGAWIEILLRRFVDRLQNRSHPARGAWIEIRYKTEARETTRSRTPQGVRGLKFGVCTAESGFGGDSRTPQGVRGLKLKIFCVDPHTRSSRTPQGVRGLKYAPDLVFEDFSGRTPQGVRGLKYAAAAAPGQRQFRVAPRKGCVD